MNLFRKWLGGPLCLLLLVCFAAEQSWALLTPDLDDENLLSPDEDSSNQEETSSLWKKLSEEGSSGKSFKAGSLGGFSCLPPLPAQPLFCAFCIRSCSKIHCKEADVLLADKVPHRPYYLLYRQFKSHLFA